MKVEDLIKELEKLPKGSTVGTIDEEGRTISNYVSIVTQSDTIYTSFGDTVNVKEIEDARHSNETSICDYYVV